MMEVLLALGSALAGGIGTFAYQEVMRRRSIRTALAVEASGAHQIFVEVGPEIVASHRALVLGEVGTVALAIETVRCAHSGFVIDSPDVRIDTTVLSQEEVKTHRVLLDRWNRFTLHEERYRSALQAAFDRLASEPPAGQPSSIAQEHIARARGEANHLAELAFQARDIAVELVCVLDKHQNRFGTNFTLDKLTGGIWATLPERVEMPELPVRVELPAGHADTVVPTDDAEGIEAASEAKAASEGESKKTKRVS